MAWSSYRSYAYQEEGRVKINEWPKALMKVRAVAQLESQGSITGAPLCTSRKGWASRPNRSYLRNLRRVGRFTSRQRIDWISC
jgi:hypothetical protein